MPYKNYVCSHVLGFLVPGILCLLLSISADVAVLAHTASPAACDSISIPAGATALRSSVITVPINTSDVTGQGVLSFDTTVSYDASVLTYIGTDQSGTVSQGMTLTINSNTAGQLIISGYSSAAASGSGVLLKLKFFTTGAIGTSSALNITPFTYNEGTPCSTTANGSVTIISGTISGVVSYANAASFRPVPNTLLSAAGSVNTSASSALFSGAYSLSGLGSGSYTVTPSKTTDVNGITGFDSALIAQQVVNLTSLNSVQLVAADVSQNGQVTSFDAALIAQWIALIPNPGVTGTWRFSPTSRTYPNVETDQPNQDYSGVLMGEVSGNWAAPTSSANLLEATLSPNLQPSVTVTAPTQFATTNFDFTVPVNVTALPNPGGAFTGVLSYQFDVTYNPNVIQPLATPVDLNGTISNGSFPTYNVPTPGLLKVVVFRASPPMTGAGTLLNLRFHASGAPGSSSPLTWSSFMFNEGDPPNTPVNGLITILGPTAATVMVSGRVVGPDGSGVKSAVVELHSPSGETVTARSNSFGYYRFDAVASGSSYMLTAQARGLHFPTRVVLVTDSLVNEDIVANQ